LFCFAIFNREKSFMSAKNQKPDLAGDLMDDIEKFEHFAVSNWKNIIWAAVAVVAAAVGTAVFFTVKRSNDARAANAVSAAKTVDELESAVANYSGHQAVYSAMINLAAKRIEGKDFKKAAALYEKIGAANGIPDDMRWRAKLNLASILELEGQSAKAAESFAALGSDAVAPELAKSEANYNAGRLYLLLGDKEKARQYLSKVNPSKEHEGALNLWGKLSKTLLVCIDTPPAIAADPEPPAASPGTVSIGAPAPASGAPGTVSIGAPAPASGVPGTVTVTPVKSPAPAGAPGTVTVTPAKAPAPAPAK
jgi:tetratricopeptide (TPR) repeat protein